MSNFCVYVITLQPNNFFYIGSTENIERRLKYHLTSLSKNKHHNILLQEAWKESTGYLLNVIPTNTRNEAFELEEKLIKQSIFNNDILLTNIGINSRGGDNITNHPNKDNIIINRSLTQKDNNSKLSKDELVSKYGKFGSKNGMYGRTHTEKVKRNLSNMKKGHSFNKGVKLSKEHVEKIRQRQKLRIGPANSFYGKHHTQETKNILSSKNKGKLPINCKEVSINGQTFISLSEAGRFYGINTSAVAFRLKSKYFKDWYIIKNDSAN